MESQKMISARQRIAETEMTVVLLERQQRLPFRLMKW